MFVIHWWKQKACINKEFAKQWKYRESYKPRMQLQHLSNLVPQMTVYDSYKPQGCPDELLVLLLIVKC